MAEQTPWRSIQTAVRAAKSFVYPLGLSRPLLVFIPMYPRVLQNAAQLRAIVWPSTWLESTLLSFTVIDPDSTTWCITSSQVFWASVGARTLSWQLYNAHAAYSSSRARVLIIRAQRYRTQVNMSVVRRSGESLQAPGVQLGRPGTSPDGADGGSQGRTLVDASQHRTGT